MAITADSDDIDDSANPSSNLGGAFKRISFTFYLLPHECVGEWCRCYIFDFLLCNTKLAFGGTGTR